MRARGVSTATSLIALIVIMFLVAGVLAFSTAVQVTNVKEVQKAIGEAGEAHSELLRVYVHPKNNSDPLSRPIVTIINPSPREVVLRQLVAVKRDGGLLKAGMLPQELTIPPSSRTTVELSALGLQFNSFLEVAQTLKAAYLITGRGNSFGSTFGPPPPEILEGQPYYEENSSIDIIYYNVETQYNFSLTDTLNITGGEAYVVVNSYVFDKEGKILGGIENGLYFTSGLIEPGSIPWDGAGLYQVPIWGYFLVPDATREFYVHYSEQFGGGYVGKARLQYIEVVAVYPPEWHSPGGSGSAPAPYMRYGTITTLYGKPYSLLLPYTMNYPKAYTTAGRIITEYMKEDEKTYAYTATLPVPVEHASGYLLENYTGTTAAVTSTSTTSTAKSDSFTATEQPDVRWYQPSVGRYLTIDYVELSVPRLAKIKLSILDENGQPVRLTRAGHCPYCAVYDDRVECSTPYYIDGAARCSVKPAGSRTFTKFGIKYWDVVPGSVYYRGKFVTAYPSVEVSYQEYILTEYVYAYEGPVKSIGIEEKVLSASETNGGDEVADIYASWEISYPDSLLYPIKVEAWADGRTPSGDACSRFHSFRVDKISAEVAEKDGWYPSLHVRGELVAWSDYKYCIVTLYVKVTYARAVLAGMNVGQPTPIVIDRIKLVEPLSFIKIDAPIVLINRVYYIDKNVQPPPPSSGGGRSPVVPVGCVVVASYCESRAPEKLYEEERLSIYVGDVVCVYAYECNFQIEVVAK